MASMKITDIWKPRETMRDWGKTEYKIVRNWTPHNKLPTPPPNPDTQQDESPIKLTRSTTLRSFQCDNNSLKNLPEAVDGNHDNEGRIPLDHDNHVSDTDDESNDHSNSRLVNISTRVTRSSRGKNSSEGVRRRMSSKTSARKTAAESYHGQAQSNEMAKLEAIKNLGTTGPSNKDVVRKKKNSSKDTIGTAVSSGVSEAKRKPKKSTTKRTKNRLSLPRRKATSSKAKRSSKQATSSTTDVKPRLSDEDESVSAGLKAKATEQGSGDDQAIPTASPPRRKSTKKRAVSITCKPIKTTTSSTVKRSKPQSSSRSKLSLSAEEDRISSASESEEERPPPAKISRTETSLSGDDDGTSGVEDSEYEKKKSPVGRKGAHKGTEGSVRTLLWQPRGVTRSRGDFSELDVCLNAYEDTIKQALESCSNQTVSMAMLTHWKYTRKEMLSLVKTLHYTVELQKLKRKERAKEKRLKQDMSKSLTELRKAHGKYQECLSAAKQVRKDEQEESLSEELSAVANGLRRIWNSQSASSLGET